MSRQEIAKDTQKASPAAIFPEKIYLAGIHNSYTIIIERKVFLGEALAHGDSSLRNSLSVWRGWKALS
jgi:hypothetical protein